MTHAAAPLIATTDLRLIDEGLRWCAAVGASPTRADDVAAVRRSWRGASAVLVGDDLLDDLAQSSLPRREHVVVVARDLSPSRWSAAARRVSSRWSVGVGGARSVDPPCLY